MSLSTSEWVLATEEVKEAEEDEVELDDAEGTELALGTTGFSEEKMATRTSGNTEKNPETGVFFSQNFLQNIFFLRKQILGTSKFYLWLRDFW